MKIRSSILIAASIALFSEPTSASDVYVPEGYSNYGMPETRVVERPMDFVIDQLSAFPENFGSGNPRLDIKSFLDRADRLVIEVTETGFLDDSVSGSQKRYVLKAGDQGGFQLWGYGYRQKCYRGENTDDWIADRCP